MGALSTKPVSTTDNTEYRSQLTHEIIPLTFQQTTRYTQSCLEPETKSNRLYLGPNEVFFDNSSNIQVMKSAASKDNIANLEWNQGKLFKYIYGLGRSLKATLFWSFFTAQTTTLSVSLHFPVRHACTLRLTIETEGHKTQSIDLNLMPSTNSQNMYAARFQIHAFPAGFHSLRANIVNTTKKRQTLGPFYYLKLGSTHKMSVVRERWRPLACHIKFNSSLAKKVGLKKVHRLVMSMEKLPSLAVFAPLSTAFGYYGPVFKEGKAPGMNFSLWSFGKKQKNNPPPRHEWSRILAIGQPDGIFSEFTHEGTGVKPRFETSPFKGLEPPYTVALQLKCEEEPHGYGYLTTYISHFWNGEEWKLFSSGKKHNSKPVTNMNVKAFIEVPGVAEKQRTNHVPRIVQYRGFISGPEIDDPEESKTNEDLDDFEELNQSTQNNETPPFGWFPLDEIIEPTGRGAVYTNKTWGAEEEYLFASCGGLDQKKCVKASTPHSMSQSNDVWPEYMYKIYQISEPLPYPKIESAELLESNIKKVQLSIIIPEHNKIQTCKVYYGPEDGLTIARLWKKCVSFYKVESGIQEYTLPAAKCYRVLLERSDGKYWSESTFEME